MHILPGLGVYWRDHDTIQIGLDSRIGMIVEGLSRSEQEFVSLLTTQWTHTEIERVAKEHGVSPSRLSEILTMLGRSGLLVGSDVPQPPAPSSADGSITGSTRTTNSLQLHGLGRVSPQCLAERRTRRNVHVESLDALGTAIALKLAENGISALSFGDEGLVRRHDHPLMWPRWDGLPRVQAMTTLLRQLSPNVRVIDGGTPDLAVVTGSRLILPRCTDQWMEQSVPHLVAWTEEIDTCIGPIVEPHHSACAACLHEHHVDRDEAWNLLAAQSQAIARLNPTNDTRDLAASIAVRSILGFFDGHGNPLHEEQWRIPPVPNSPFLISVQPHPRCGCASYTAMVKALQSALPPAPQRKVRQLHAVGKPTLPVDHIENLGAPSFELG